MKTVILDKDGTFICSGGSKAEIWAKASLNENDCQRYLRDGYSPYEKGIQGNY